MTSLHSSTTDEYSSSKPKGAPTVSFSFDDDFADKNEFKHLSELKKINEIKSVNVLGTIKMLCNEAPWYYIGCKKCSCKMKVRFTTYKKLGGSCEMDERKKYECNSVTCKNLPVSPIPKFRVQVRVQDATDGVTLTLFDRHCGKLLKTNAQEPVQKNQEAADEYTFPNELNALVNRKCLFRIDISEYNISTNSCVYGVSRLSEDASIISSMERKYNIQQEADLNSVDIINSPTTTQETVSYQDVMSSIGNYPTPTS